MNAYKSVGDFLFLDCVSLVVDSRHFPLSVNPPLVTELKVSEVTMASSLVPYCTVLYKVMMTGSLVYPHRLQLEFAEEELTEVEWFASERVEEGEASANKKAKVEKEDALVWRSVGRGRLYTPTLQVYLRTLHIVHPYSINIYTPTLYTLFSVQYTPTL